MLVRDTKDQYGLVSVLLHWIIALGVVVLLVTGTIGFVEGRGPFRTAILNFHLSLASVLAPLILFRLYWRLKSGKPKLPPQHPALDGLAAAVWRLLLFGMVAQLLTGPQLSWLHAHPIGIVGFAEIQSPYPPLTQETIDRAHAVAKFIHASVGFSIAGLLILHVLGALKHAIVDRDGILVRISKPGARARVAAAALPDGATIQPASGMDRLNMGAAE
jgi:cytochrome b561